MTAPLWVWDTVERAERSLKGIETAADQLIEAARLIVDGLRSIYESQKELEDKVARILEVLEEREKGVVTFNPDKREEEKDDERPDDQRGPE